MTYFKINENDYSLLVNSLKVNKKANYSAQTNAAGNTVVDYINSKYVIEVGFIPLSGEDMERLQMDIERFEVIISFLNPVTNELREHIACIIPESGVEYYTIQQNKVMYKAFTLTFTEL